MYDNRATDVLIGLGIGMIAGAVTALLLAPKSGEETRRQIGDMGRDAIEQGRQTLDSARQTATDTTRQIGETVQEGVETARRAATDQVRRVGQAIEDGRKGYLKEPSQS